MTTAKKILWIVLALVVLALIGCALYHFFYVPTNTQNPHAISKEQLEAFTQGSATATPISKTELKALTATSSPRKSTPPTEEQLKALTQTS
jgi:hypothetical protein